MADREDLTIGEIMEIGDLAHAFGILMRELDTFHLWPISYLWRRWDATARTQFMRDNLPVVESGREFLRTVGTTFDAAEVEAHRQARVRIAIDEMKWPDTING